MSATVDKLRSFADLPEGWDSYGAPKIDGRCIDLACEIAESLEATSLGPAQPIPSTDGGVCLSWTQDGYEVDVDINPAPSE